MAAITPRVAPLSPPYDADVADMLAKWMPPGAEVEPLNLFRTLSLNMALAGRMRPLGAYILGKSMLDPAEREIAINRTCARCGCDYEWGVHVAAFGAAVGLSREKLAATVTQDATADIWTQRESLVIQLVDELHDTATISDVLWGDMREHWSELAIMELIVCTGFYRMISYIANGLNIEQEPWAANFRVQNTTQQTSE